MAAVTVTGNLSDFSDLVIPAELMPRLEFYPSSSALAGGRILAAQPKRASLNATAGNWTVQLNETELLQPVAWYTAVIRWFAPGGQFQYEERLPQKIYVPIGGGNISTFPSKPNPGSIVAGFGKPEPRHAASAYFDLTDVTANGVMLYLPKGSV